MNGHRKPQRATPEASPRERAAAAASLGLRPTLTAEEAAALEASATDDPDPRVRGAALGALARHAGAHPETLATTWRVAVADADAGVRRRALELAPGVPGSTEPVVAALADADPLVAEAAAFALGEAGDTAAVQALADVVTGHEDALVREAAVAALGALGADAGLPAVISALGDRPPVRRRAVLALAAFSGPEVEAALARATRDRDWQVRQAAEELLRA